MQQALKLADDTRDVLIRPGAIDELSEFFRKNFGNKRPVIVADHSTLAAIGGAENSLAESVEKYLFADSIHAEMLHVKALQKSRLFEPDDVVPVAVGSGTVNDLVKYTSSLYHKPYCVVGTAASMDGYTSFGASIDSNGCKQTFSCAAPAALLIDTVIAANAPDGMSAAGYADLAAKIPAGADWLLADFLGTEPIDAAAWHLVQDDLRRWLADSDKIPRRDENAINGLIEGLVMSGLAMQKARSSRTASGAEHQFSHLLDNEHHTFNGKAPSHGFKVGVGTIATSALYEKVLSWDASVFERSAATLNDHFQTWETLEAQVRSSFSDPGLIAASLSECRKKYVDMAEARNRLERFAVGWDGLRERLTRQLIPASTIQKMIHASGAPSTPEEIGISRKRLCQCYAKARLLRCRYNVLDLVAEVGLWDETVGALFEPGGFWEK